MSYRVCPFFWWEGCGGWVCCWIPMNDPSRPVIPPEDVFDWYVCWGSKYLLSFGVWTPRVDDSDFFEQSIWSQVIFVITYTPEV